MSMSNMGIHGELQLSCVISNPKLTLEHIMELTGAGDGTRTRDTLLGRYIALNGVARRYIW